MSSRPLVSSYCIKGASRTLQPQTIQAPIHFTNHPTPQKQPWRQVAEWRDQGDTVRDVSFLPQINTQSRERKRTHIIPPQTLSPTRIKASRIRRTKLLRVVDGLHERLRRVHNHHFHACIRFRKRLNFLRQRFVVLYHGFAFGCDVLCP